MSNPTKTIDNQQSLGIAGTVLSVNSDTTFNGAVTLPANSIAASSINGISSYSRLDGSTFIGPVTISNVLSTQGLVYETVNAMGGVVNAYTLDYAVGGIYSIPTAISPTANFTITITNIPTSLVQTYTFTVGFYQMATRYYANQIKVRDTSSVYILGSSGAFDVPMFNGGIPTMTGTTPCFVAQQFTVFPNSGSRYVMSSVSVCSTTAAAAVAVAGVDANIRNVNYTTLPTLTVQSIGYQYAAFFDVNIPAGTATYTSQLGSFPAGVYYCEAAGTTPAIPTTGSQFMFYFTADAINVVNPVGNKTGSESPGSIVATTSVGQYVYFSCSGVYVCPNAGDLKFGIYSSKAVNAIAASGGQYKITRIA